MRPVFADLVAEIQRSIGFYASVHREHEINKVIALGGTFRMPGLQKYLQQNLQLDVQRLDNSRRRPAGGRRSPPCSTKTSCRSPARTAWRCRRWARAKVDSSLLPTAIRQSEMWQEKNKWFAGAAALFLLGAGIGYGKYFVEDSFNASGPQAARAKIDSVIADGKRSPASGRPSRAPAAGKGKGC